MGGNSRYKAVSRPGIFSTNNDGGPLFVTTKDISDWLNKMYEEGWEFISYGTVSWRTEGRMSDEFWIFKRIEK